MSNLNTIYCAIKSAAADREHYYHTFKADHPDRVLLYNLNNHIVADLVREYKDRGGKRDVDRFLRADK